MSAVHYNISLPEQTCISMVQDGDSYSVIAAVIEQVGAAVLASMLPKLIEASADFSSASFTYTVIKETANIPGYLLNDISSLKRYAWNEIQKIPPNVMEKFKELQQLKEILKNNGTTAYAAIQGMAESLKEERRSGWAIRTIQEAVEGLHESAKSKPLGIFRKCQVYISALVSWNEA